MRLVHHCSGFWFSTVAAKAYAISTQIGSNSNEDMFGYSLAEYELLVDFQKA